MTITRGKSNGKAEQRPDERTVAERTVAERWTLRAALGALAVLTLLAAVGRYNARSGGLLVLREWFDRPLLFFTLALPFLLAVLFCIRWWVWLRVVLGICVMLAAVATVPLWIVVDSPRTTRTVAAPDRPDRRLVIQEQGWSMQSVEWVYVDEGSGLTARRWEIAYVGRPVASVEAAWAGPNRLEVTADGWAQSVDLAADGRPLSPVDLG
ncbi:hypothetical protein [Kitasatospora aureofaciens]|uniref:hypothetical protein n=1 Tax=Kitasatospora aureofaciens TaxID=1894 RepID=UPI001C467C32|nr:hypothetical protein [Kitasatospora aureofaciens]MBV6700632.1 hypothetical protein [Kitasatospora aureofaciens]